MSDKVNTFLNSGLLDKYLIGQTSASETTINAVKAPQLALDNILNQIDNDSQSVVQLHPKKNRKWYNFAIAASVAALLFAGSSAFLFNQNKILTDENQIIADEIFDLRSDIANNNDRLNLLLDQFAQLNNPETEKYVLKGNKRAKNLKTVAYINPKEKTSMIDVVSLPTLPDDQVYQIWAQIQGKMVNLGILSEADRRLQEIPYTEDALGLSISVEPKGGSQVRSNDTPVAEISLKLND